MKTQVDSTSNDTQSAIERWKKELLNLQNRLQDFKDDVARTENIFEETRQDIELAQFRADRNRQVLKMETARQDKMMKKVTELEEFVNPKQRLQENTAPHYCHEPNARNYGGQNSLSRRITSLLKIGSLALLELVAAYTLFRISKPFLCLLKI